MSEKLKQLTEETERRLDAEFVCIGNEQLLSFVLRHRDVIYLELRNLPDLAEWFRILAGVDVTRVRDALEAEKARRRQLQAK